MFTEALTKTATNARVKANMLKKSFGRYFVLSILGGFYIGIAVVLTNSLAAPLAKVSFPIASLLIGLIFPVGLMLIVFAGAELFTGNVLFCSIGLGKRIITPKNSVLILIVSYLGNLTGALIISFIIYSSGLLYGDMAEFILITALNKASLPFMQIFIRAVMCNIMVCLALWSGIRTKSEVMKYICIAMCLLTFIGSGYIHSVADMTHLTLAWLAGENQNVIGTFSLFNWLYVMFSATLGNIMGGMLIASAYLYAGTEKEQR